MTDNDPEAAMQRQCDADEERLDFVKSRFREYCRRYRQCDETVITMYSEFAYIQGSQIWPDGRQRTGVVPFTLYANCIRTAFRSGGEFDDRFAANDCRFVIEDDRVRICYDRFDIRKQIASPAIMVFATSGTQRGLIVEERTISVQV